MDNVTETERSITVVSVRDYGDVVPVKGVVMGGGRNDLLVMVDVAAQDRISS